MRDMPAPRKYPPELRERAIRMTVEARRHAATRDGAIARTADQLGANRETLRNWVAQAEVDAGHRPGTTTDPRPRAGPLPPPVHAPTGLPRRGIGSRGWCSVQYRRLYVMASTSAIPKSTTRMPG
ncbi:transposase [Nocardiopsis sp. NPDC006198]|uniref:transposase n=1 Tax=Nocardiopsis sp. NPDC006198 TaxID=3154472 RepID=UPI0033AFBEC4